MHTSHSKPPSTSLINVLQMPWPLNLYNCIDIKFTETTGPKLPFLLLCTAHNTMSPKLPFFILCSVEEDDEFSEGRRKFLEACHSRLRQAPLTATGENYPGGAEDIVAGCGCFMRLSNRPKANAVQILLLAVRHRWRRAGLGSFLLHVCNDSDFFCCSEHFLFLSDNEGPCGGGILQCTTDICRPQGREILHHTWVCRRPHLNS